MSKLLYYIIRLVHYVYHEVFQLKLMQTDIIEYYKL